MGDVHARWRDDEPAVVDLEPDRLRGRSAPDPADHLADGRGRYPPLWLRRRPCAHRAARQQPDRHGHQAGRSRRHAGVERLPAFRAVLRDLRHRRGLPHDQPAALGRAVQLRRQSLSRQSHLLRPHVRAVDRETGRRLEAGWTFRRHDRSRAYAGRRADHAVAHVLRRVGDGRWTAHQLAGIRRERGGRALLHFRHDRRAQGRALLASFDCAARAVCADRHGARVRAGSVDPARGADVPRQCVGAQLHGTRDRHRHGAARRKTGRRLTV